MLPAVGRLYLNLGGTKSLSRYIERSMLPSRPSRKLMIGLSVTCCIRPCNWPPLSSPLGLIFTPKPERCARRCSPKAENFWEKRTILHWASVILTPRRSSISPPPHWKSYVWPWRCWRSSSGLHLGY
ncbi:unnamed protein product [Pelagomonas calceolata]|uniref:Uncharacterized protein n=1 Tax=Pelagomonas calceolata TaxID=35677 RepID=A0A8J2WRV3_9STRA|nr:unnamed protein product [Pelagomonas calceolata]